MFGTRNLTDVGLRLLQNVSFHGLRVQGIRVGNAEIPQNKLLRYALQNIHGIGATRARQILADLNLTSKRASELSGRDLFCLCEEVSKYMIENDLRRCVKHDVERLVNIQCYRGIRHNDALPCRGQRTRDNARTARSKPNRLGA